MLPTNNAPKLTTQGPNGDGESRDPVEHLIDAAVADRSLLRQIIDASTDGFKLLDIEGRLLSMNLAGQHIVGAAEPSSLIGKPWVDIWKGAERQLAVTALERARSGGVGEFEAVYTDSTGGPRWRHVRVTPIVDSSGVTQQLLVISQETTRAKLISEHLAESESRERGIIESATDYAIFVMDVEGHVTRWGKGAEKTFGYSAAEILHQDSAVLWPAEDLPHAPIEERRLTVENGCADDNRWHVRKDGTRFFARGALQPILNAESVVTGFVKICRDETDQLQIKTQLADTRIRLDAALAAGEIATWVFDLVADKVYGDANLLRFFGISATESTGLPLATYLNAVHPDDRQRVTADVQRAIEFTGVFESEYRIDVGGGDRWVVARGKVERDAAGKAIRLPGVVLDITARKKAEEARRESEARYRSLFDSMDEGFCVVEVIFDDDEKPIDYIYLEVNPAFERQSGLVDAAGKSTRLLIPGLEQHWFETYGRVAKTGIPVRYENDATSMGRSFDVYAFRIDNPALNRVAIIFKDTTEQRKALVAIKQSEKQFRELADAMPQIVWAARPDGTLDYYNRRWFDFIGLAPEQFEQATWDRYVHDDDLARVAAAWTHSIQTGSVYQSEFRVRNAAGQYRWFLVRALAIRSDGGVITRWFGTCTDIEDQKEMQAQKERLLSSERAARDEAERASQMKDEFLATLSHELRTPLNAILGWSQIIRSADHNPEDVTQGIEVIERNARAQSQIIEDLLDMSRIISGKVRLDVQRLNLSAIVQAAVETARPTAAAKQIRLTSVVDPLHGVTVSGDANRMQQVLWNLLSNAVKFTPKGGRVQVLLERVNSHLEISVIDTGEGIAADFLPFVFDRFRQADASSTRQHGGLGLGLSIVKQLVELHGGSVRVKSTGPGQGSTFIVALPLTVVHPDPQAEAERRHPRVTPNDAVTAEACVEVHGVRVLVVDDEPDARALVKRVLEDCKAIVTTAASAAEAIEQLRAGTFDVLVSDIGMPGEDGYTLIKRVRALGRGDGGAIPAIALTAYARAEDRVKAVAAGFLMHVAKPVEPVELVTMVAGAAGRTGR